jgi:addiction module RelB/DinJ family antitoxin
LQTNAQLNIKIDAALKKDVEAVSKQIGLTSSDAIRVFLIQYVHHRGFPFDVTVKEEEWDYRKRYNAKTVDIIERSYDPTNLTEIDRGTLEDFDQHMQWKKLSRGTSFWT